MRLAIAIACLALPAHAWEFRVTEICELFHEMPGASVRLTYDPRIPEYAIRLTRTPAWPAGSVFAIRFDGGRPLTITTDRHVLSDGNATIGVTDRGFGNVLNGLEFNRTATALLADAALAIPLDGAAGPVRDFRACAAGGVA